MIASPFDELLTSPTEVGDAARSTVVNTPFPGEFPEETNRRVLTEQARAAQAQRQADAAQRQADSLALRQANARRQTEAATQRQATQLRVYKAKDLSSRGIPSYADPTGEVHAVTDESGAPLTGFQRTKGVALDSTGTPRRLQYGETGAPVLGDAFDGLPTRTDKKTGQMTRVIPGVGTKVVGVDPYIAARNAAAEKDKAIRDVASVVGGKLRLEDKNLSIAEKEHAKIFSELYGSAPMLKDAKGKAFSSLIGADPTSQESIIAAINEGYDKKRIEQKGAANIPELEKQRARSHRLAAEYFAYAPKVEAARTAAQVIRQQANDISNARLEDKIGAVEAAGIDLHGLLDEILKKKDSGEPLPSLSELADKAVVKEPAAPGATPGLPTGDGVFQPPEPQGGLGLTPSAVPFAETPLAKAPLVEPGPEGPDDSGFWSSFFGTTAKGGLNSTATAVGLAAALKNNIRNTAYNPSNQPEFDAIGHHLVELSKGYGEDVQNNFRIGEAMKPLIARSQFLMTAPEAESAAGEIRQIAEEAPSAYGADPRSENPAAQFGRGTATVALVAPSMAMGGGGVVAGAIQFGAQAYSESYTAAAEQATQQGITNPEEIAQIASEAGFSAASRTAPAMLLFMGAGKLAAGIAGKMAGETASPLQRALFGTAGAEIANIGAGNVIRRVESGDWHNTIETLTVDTLFALVHGVGEYSGASAKAKQRAATELAARGFAERVIASGPLNAAPETQATANQRFSFDGKPESVPSAQIVPATAKANSTADALPTALAAPEATPPPASPAPPTDSQISPTPPSRPAGETTAPSGESETPVEQIPAQVSASEQPSPAAQPPLQPTANPAQENIQTAQRQSESAQTSGEVRPSGEPVRGSAEGQAKIVSTAIRLPDGSFVTGKDWNSPHADFTADAMEKGAGIDSLMDPASPLRGFVVEDAAGNRRFVERAEAYRIAGAAGQRAVENSKGELNSQDLQPSPSPIDLAGEKLSEAPPRAASETEQAPNGEGVSLFRASDSPEGFKGAHFSESRSDAEEYQDNPGFGGKNLYEYKVNMRSPLELRQSSARDLRSLSETYAEASGEDAQEVLQSWKDSGYDSVFSVLENSNKVQKALADRYDWIRFLDDFPENAVTWKNLSPNTHLPIKTPSAENPGSGALPESPAEPPAASAPTSVKANETISEPPASAPTTPKIEPASIQQQTRLEPAAILEQKEPQANLKQTPRDKAKETPEPSSPKTEPEKPGAQDSTDPESSATSIKNAVVDKERAKRGLPPAMEPAAKEFGTTWDEAMRKIEADSDAPRALVDSLELKPRPVHDWENAMLLHRQITLQNEYAAAQRATIRAAETGDPAVAEESRLRSAWLRDELQRIYDVGKKVGTENSRGLNTRKLLAAEDYSLEAMTYQKRAANGGKKLTEEQTAEVEKAHAAIEAKQKVADEAAAQKDQEGADRAIDDALSDMLERSKKDPELNTEAKSLAERIVARLDKAASAAGIRLLSKLRQLGSAPDPTILADAIIYGTAKIAKGFVKFASWSKSMVTDLGNGIVPYLEGAWKKANEALDNEITIGATPTQRQTVKKAVRGGGDKIGKMEEGIGAIAKEGADIKKAAPYIRRIAEALVRQGINKRNPLVDRVHEILKPHFPEVTRRQTMDAISGYGDFFPLNKDPVKVQLREIKGELQQEAKLQDIQAKVPLQMTGVERRPKGDEERRLEKEVNAAKKKYGVVVTDPATQLKSAQDGYVTRLRNEIVDLTWQIETGEKPPAKTDLEWNDEIETLRGLRERVRKTLKDVSEKPGATEEQRVAVAVKSMEREIAEYERQIREGETIRPEIGRKALTSDKLDTLEARRDAVKAERDEMVAADSELQEVLKINRLEKQIGDAEEALANPKPKGGKESTVDTEAAAAARAKLAELRATMAAAGRRPKADPEQTRLAALEKRRDDLALKVADADTSAKVGKPNVPTAEQAEVQTEIEGLNKLLSEMRAAEMRKPAEQVEFERVSAALRKAQEKLDAVKAGTFKEQGRQQTVDTPAVAKAREDLAALNREIADLRREELGNRAFRARAARRLADLRDRNARGDYEPRPPRPKLNLDSESLHAQAEVEREKIQFQRGLMRDRLSKRGRFERTLDGIAKWRRAFVLSGWHTIAKLTSAAFEINAFAPVEEVVGGVIGKLPGVSRVAELAPRHGGLNIRAEAEAITQTVRNFFRDIGQYMKTGDLDIDALHGKPHLHPFEWKEIFGRIHGALKTPTRRNEFTRSYQKRLEFAGRNGADITDPLVQTRIATDAYKDANKSIFMEDNILVDFYRRGLSRFTQADKATGKVAAGQKTLETAAKFLLPVVRIPSNIVARTFEYTVGSVTGSFKLARALSRGLDKLTPDQADLIMQNLKRGSLGASLLLLGFLNPQNIGGYYTGKRDDEDVQPGGLRVFGVNVPKVVIHNPLLEQFQFGATIRRYMDSRMDKGKGRAEALGDGVLAAALGLAKQTPFIDQAVRTSEVFNERGRGRFIGELGKSLIPQGVKEIADATDQDPATGEPTKRKPEGVLESMKMAIPGMRKTVPAKDAGEPGKPARPAAPPRPKLPVVPKALLDRRRTGLNDPRRMFTGFTTTA